ncbi:hypothetical protein NIES4102_22430 [Chondrocystis sp. NIES-4102]|nr:hypothetical protein NIES4102_22430 [Chondrocystis sp. NIES-4102]
MQITDNIYSKRYYLIKVFVTINMSTKFLFLVPLLTYNFPISTVNAQSVYNCSLTINKVIEEAYSHGTSVNVSVNNSANNYRIGNPTPRDGSLSFTFGQMNYSPNNDYYISLNNYNSKNNNIAYNILNSTQLQHNWADNLVKNCGNLAEVSFGLAHTDWIIDHAIQKDGTTKKRECLNMSMGDSSGSLPWNYQFC